MNRRSFLLSLLSVVATAVIPPFLLRIAAAQPSDSNVVPQQDEYGSHTDTSISEEPQRPTMQGLHEVPIEPRPLRNLHGDTYCIHVSAGFGMGKSHQLKSLYPQGLRSAIAGSQFSSIGTIS